MKQNSSTHERLADRLANILTLLNIGSHLSSKELADQFGVNNRTIMLPVILFPKHPICFVGKKELVKIPIFGTIYKRICVMVDRSSARSRAEVYKRCAERMAEGDSIVIFPEGGVPDDTSVLLAPFKDGAFILSREHQSPIAVFTFVGLKEMFPFNNGQGHPGKVRIFMNDIIEPTKNIQELKEVSHNLIKFTLENN